MRIRAFRILLLLACLLPSVHAIPQVNVFVDPPLVGEGSSVQFIFRKDGPGTAFVPFTFSGTAIEGTNFVTGTGAHSVIIPDNLKELRLLVYTRQDKSTNTDVNLIL